MKYTNKQIQDLAIRYKLTNSNSDFEALILMLEPLTQKLLNKYYISTYEDKDDILQVCYCLIANSISDYNEELSSYKNFYMTICSKRLIYLFKKANLTKKRISQDKSFSIHKTVISEGENLTLLDMLPAPKVNNDDNSDLICFLSNYNLSETELEIFTQYLEGYSYKEIAERINSNIKSVDNAILRSINKLKEQNLDKGQIKELLNCRIKEEEGT